ncbi:GntR family transcriptional regulator [Herbaspirillum sp. YR522]|uniref:GntR family transcriptional regulator n=1 Tax=Herbaspirillum sp. YR522 TaxID=1144342 RepID=UPI00026F4B19|nr:GntR family transcriptional regulator [Herbaspirillum sp. YR522]EJM97454.1 transcriptional regulator [Herbaspirillum sp. YR522]
MYKIDSATQLIEQVYDALLDAICSGALAPNQKITQEGIAEQLGVSRQPVHQAFQLLKRQGFIADAARKGVMVTAIDAQHLLQLYQVRAVLDGLAARAGAERWKHDAQACSLGQREGQALLARGRAAGARDDLSACIVADMDFHQFIYRSCGNPVVAETTAIHWHHIRRAMGAFLSAQVRSHVAVWAEHEAILQAMIQGRGALADKLARQHAESSAQRLAQVLASTDGAAGRACA